MNKNLKRNIKKLVANILGGKSIVPLLYFDYFRTYKRILDLSDPKTFGAKIHWIKKYGNIERYKDLVDKYRVREYIEQMIGDKYLVKLYGVYESTSEINIDNLPNSFVLKCNQGSGEVIICKDKSRFDWNKARKLLDEWIEIDYYSITKEVQYKDIERRIICEEYLEDESGSLRDYKIFCFNGVPKYIQVDSDRFSDHKRDFYNNNWEKIELKAKYKNSNYVIKRPDNLDEMLNVAEKLSKNFEFIRVDLYCSNNKVYFGELTFTPDNGCAPYEPYEKDLEIAAMIDLNKYNSYMK
ncbi:ATP-grasp fold amidoligase family protein [Clostridium disporicum]|uniref:ATP-grasp fold amidoligase family protein n=1 Tax=Clostridium disporicum TaxID=84024 RepID=UPI003621D5BF